MLSRASGAAVTGQQNEGQGCKLLTRTNKNLRVTEGGGGLGVRPWLLGPAQPAAVCCETVACALMTQFRGHGFLEVTGATTYAPLTARSAQPASRVTPNSRHIGHLIKVCPWRRAKPPRAACRMVDRHRLLPRPFSRHPRASEHLAPASPPPDEAAKGSTARHRLSPRPCLQQQDDGGT